MTGTGELKADKKDIQSFNRKITAKIYTIIKCYFIAICIGIKFYIAIFNNKIIKDFFIKTIAPSN